MKLDRATLFLGVLGIMMLGKRKSVVAQSAQRFTWSDDEVRAYIDTVRAAGADPRMGLAVYNLESQLNPNARNVSSDAQGLAQFMPATLRGLGYHGDASAFHELPLLEQLPWIGRLIESQVRDLGHAPETESQWMHLQLSPATVRQGPLVYRAPSAGYDANKWLDPKRKGTIDETDLAVALSRAKGATYAAALAALDRIESEPKPPVIEPVPVAGELSQAVAATELDVDDTTEVTAIPSGEDEPEDEARET